MMLKELKCIDNNINIEEYINFREDVKSYMEYPEWLGDFTKEELIDMLSNNSKIWIYKDNNIDVSSCMIIPSTKKAINKFELDLDYKEVLDYGPMFVSKDYIGNSLQYQMLKELDKYAIEHNYKYAVATVHPDNIYSINNLLKDNFKLISTKDFKRGTRNIYLKQLYEVDDKNNKIIGKLNLDNSYVKFTGENNVLLINDEITIVNSNIEFRGSNSLIYLCKTNDKITLDMKIYNNSTIYFGKNIWITRGVKIVISEMTNLFFGKNCMIAPECCIRSADPHIIYDANTKKRINRSKSIYFGDHTWIGQRVMILKNTRVGSGSVIGASSLLTNKEYKSNSIYAGVPAKRVKENIFFIHDDCHRFTDKEIEDYDYNDTDKYIYTKDNTTISFDVIEDNLNKLDINDRIDYLNNITNNNDKNRFYI